MATAVPSRFAVLAIEDDDFKPKKTAKPANSVKANQKNKSDKTKQQPKKDDKKKQSKNKKKKNVANDQQWEQWKQKDSMAVEESYEQDLHQAIMLSKIAYESQIENGSKTEKEQEQTKKGTTKKSKKSTMSLEEFNNLGNNPTQSINEKTINSNGKEKHLEADPEYFERVQKEASQEIIKGKEKDLIKARLNQIDNNEITSAQLRVELEKRDDIIKELKDDVFKLKEELSQVKNRNKKLYQILAQGEMKDKAAVLAEVAKLQEIRDELTSEVSSLHAQLEQERSKNHASNSEAKPVKQNSKKRLASENA
ncbi:G kinase-anchoring protein 1-like [Leptopilina heterotoma]|uniref:G kinase-anchoring protein 1-like n=1 Tax=Leptopilina heterotoma TaxID=63436 RepID=UPI001CAA314A|nr:G kinase-anchoring protein 1-like [Leptopilina heterotoma]